MLTSPERADDETVAGPVGGGPVLRPTWVVRAVAAVAVVLAAVYAIACVIYNLPNSPMKVRVLSPARAVIDPWFEQDWQLFAPTPSTANNHLIVSVQMARPGGGVQTTAPRDIEYPIEDKPLGNRVFPTKQPGITLALQEVFASYRTKLEAAEQGAPKAQLPRVHQLIDRQFASAFDRVGQLASYEAHQWYPDRRILQVRATFTQTPITPFSLRYASRRELAGNPRTKSQTNLTTDWLTYVPGVGRP